MSIGSIFKNGTLNTQKFGRISFSGTLTNYSTSFYNYNIQTTSTSMFQIKGTFKNYEDQAYEGSFYMAPGSIYEHCFSTTEGTIPSSIWGSNSTCKITGYTSNINPPINLTQDIANFIWNCPNQENGINFQGMLQNVTGDLTVISTGSGSISFDADLVNSYPLSVGGKFTITGGLVYLNNFDDTNTDLNISGDVVLSGGILKNTNIGNGIGNITFNKLNNNQIIEINNSLVTGISIQGKIAFKVAAGTTLEFTDGNSVLSNSDAGCTFSVLAGGALRIKHADGISSSGNTGCIQVGGSRSYSDAGTYDYGGNTLQVTGSGLPATLSTGQIVVSNPYGVKLSDFYNFTTSTGGLKVYGNGYLICNGKYISGSGFFEFNTGCKIAICSTDGIENSTSVGNIRNTGSKIINSNATFIYAGTSEQNTGSLLPASVDTLIINNTSATGVKLTNGVTVSKVLTLTDGELITYSKDLVISDKLLTTSGTISGDNASTITINGSGVLGTLTFTPSYQVLKTLTINRNSGSVTLGSALTLDGTTDGTLNLTAGVFDISGQTLSFIKGNTPIIRTNGTITTSTSSSLVFGTAGNMGGNAFTIPASTFTLEPTVNNFSVNRTNSLTLSQPININGTLTLTTGLLIGNGNLITVGSGSGNIGAISRTDGIIVGSLKRWLASSSSNYIFPLGTTSSKYNGIELQYDGSGVTASGTLTATFTLGDPGNNNNPSPIDDAGYTINKYSNYGYWTISNNAVNGNYNINLNANGFPGISATASCREKLRILKRANSGSNWSALGTHISATGTDQTCMVAKRSGLDSFSDFAIGSDMADNNFDGPLPVALSSFNSTLSSRDVNLKWVTSAEINNAGFDVERKTVEGTWSKVGYVKGNGTVNSSTTYNFTDRKLNAGKYNYRLKQIDNNGNFEYHNLSTTIEVSLPKEYQLSQNYPNPFNPTTKIDFSLPFDSKVNLIIYDISGREVKTLVNDSRQAGYHTVELNAIMMSSGTYFFRIIANANGKDFISTKKMVLVK